MKNSLKWRRAIISINNTIKYAIKKLDFAEVQILMIVSKNNKFVGTITDGDVRRGLIRGNNLEDKLEKIVNFKPIIVPPGTDINSVKELLGHESVAATQVYTHSSLERLKEIYSKAHPRSKNN